MNVWNEREGRSSRLLDRSLQGARTKAIARLLEAEEVRTIQWMPTMFDPTIQGWQLYMSSYNSPDGSWPGR